jgi:hypothetical protein
LAKQHSDKRSGNRNRHQRAKEPQAKVEKGHRRRKDKVISIANHSADITPQTARSHQQRTKDYNLYRLRHLPASFIAFSLHNLPFFLGQSIKIIHQIINLKIGVLYFMKKFIPLSINKIKWLFLKRSNS